MPVSTAGSTPAPPAVGAATMTPIAAFTSCTASARINTSRKSVPARGPGGPFFNLAASPPTSPDAENRSPTSPFPIASRMMCSARPSWDRMSATVRPESSDSARRAIADSVICSASAAAIAAARDRYMDYPTSGGNFVERDDPFHPGKPGDVVDGLRWRRVVEVDDHEGITPALLSTQTEVGDVHAIVGEYPRDCGDRSANVLRHENHGPKVPCHLDGKAIDLRNVNPA